MACDILMYQPLHSLGETRPNSSGTSCGPTYSQLIPKPCVSRPASFRPSRPADFLFMGMTVKEIVAQKRKIRIVNATDSDESDSPGYVSSDIPSKNGTQRDQVIMAADSGYESIDGNLSPILSGYVTDDECPQSETPPILNDAYISKRAGPRTSFNSIREKVGMWEVDDHSGGYLTSLRDEWSASASISGLRTDTDTPSDGELSFTGMRSASGLVTPPTDAACPSRQLALELASRILQGFAQQQEQEHHFTQHGTTTPDTRSSSAGSSPSHSSQSASTNITVPSKRRLRPIEEDDEDDVEKHIIKKRRGPEESKQIKLFACPFAKFDPQRYSERNTDEKEYRSCSSCLLRDIPRLKQHLYRIHRRPEYCCASCSQAFKTQVELDVHVRQRVCEVCPPMYEEKMTGDQMKAIKRRNRGESSHQNWFSIFKILFPGATLPASPYAGESDTDVVGHFVRYFHALGPRNFFDLMRERQGRIIQMDASTQAVVDEAFEIAAPELMGQLRQQRQQASQISSTDDLSTAASLAAETVSDMMHPDDEARADLTTDETEVPSYSTFDDGFDGRQTFDGLIGGDPAMALNLDTDFDPFSVDDAFESYAFI